jgi:hypothetical protein
MGEASPAASGSRPADGTLAPRPPAGTFHGPIVSDPGVSSRFPRLSHAQWESSVRDALRLSTPLGLSSGFVAEPLRGTFDTNGSMLSVSADLFRDYQAAAEALAATVASDPALLAAIAPAGGGSTSERAARFVTEFGLRAFRRPLTDPEVARVVALFERGAALINSGDAFADGVELALSYFFQAPHFLYRAELSSALMDGRIALSPYEVAARLSYALTNTMPDDALFAAAEGGALATRDGAREHARRLLSSPAGHATVADFHVQLLNMREYEVIAKDEAEFPQFAEGAAADLTQEAVRFVDDVIFQQDRGLVELLTAPYTFGNARIAALYNVRSPVRNGDPSDAFARLELDPSQRAGLLTQIGFLAANGEGATPNIIMRGVHIARKVLCADLPPPPANVPPLPELAPTSTNRQRVEELTKGAPCNACHTTIINPLGFALEELDGVGRHRTQDNGHTIDATGSYVLDGKSVSFDGAVDLVQRIADSQQAHDCYSRHWVEYLYGREVDMASAADRGLVEQAGSLSNSDASVGELLVNLIATDAFLTRL